MQQLQGMEARRRLCKNVRAPPMHVLPRVPDVRGTEAVLQVRHGQAGKCIRGGRVERAPCRPTCLQGLRHESQGCVALRRVHGT